MSVKYICSEGVETEMENMINDRLGKFYSKN